MALLSNQINEVLDSWLSEGKGHVVAVLDTAGPSERVRLVGDLPAERFDFLETQLSAVALPAELLPGLVPLSVAQWAVRQQTVSIALEGGSRTSCPLVCGWIWAEVDMSELRRGFASSLLRHSPDARRFIFRHHDPRVRACLHALLGRSWLQSLLPFRHSWLFIGRDGQSFARVEPCNTDSAHQPMPAPARVQQAIERCGEINLAIGLAQDQGWRFSPDAYACADDALTRCDDLGFSGETDRLAFMLHALTVSGHFDKQPEIASVLSAARAQGTPYIEAASRVPPEAWRAATNIQELKA